MYNFQVSCHKYRTIDILFLSDKEPPSLVAWCQCSEVQRLHLHGTRHTLLKMVALCFTETSAFTFHNSRHHNPEN